MAIKKELARAIYKTLSDAEKIELVIQGLQSYNTETLWQMFKDAQRKG